MTVFSFTNLSDMEVNVDRQGHLYVDKFSGYQDGCKLQKILEKLFYKDKNKFSIIRSTLQRLW